MVGRPPKPRGTSADRRKVVDQLLSDIANHQASNEKEAIERKTGQRMTGDDVEQRPSPSGQPPKTSR